MSVVNCRVANIRPRYKNLKEWTSDPENVYIGRAGVVFIDGVRFPLQHSPFANPFKIDKDGTREEVITAYKIYMEDRLATEPELREQLVALKDKNLGCWCAPERCHGDVLLELIEKHFQRQQRVTNT